MATSHNPDVKYLYFKHKMLACVFGQNHARSLCISDDLKATVLVSSFLDLVDLSEMEGTKY